MQLSRKQEIYIELMEAVLPYLRNIQTHSMHDWLRSGQFYAELELVHNLGRLLAIPEFSNYDAFWVGAQGRVYLRDGRRELPFYERICNLIRELDAMITTEMREQYQFPAL